MPASKCPLKVQISQGLGPFVQIELFKTGRSVRTTWGHVDDKRKKGAVSGGVWEGARAGEEAN